MMRFGPSLLNALREAAATAFVDRMVVHVNEHFSSRCASLGGAEQTRDAVTCGVARGVTYGIRTERHLCQFINLIFTFGDSFDTDIGWAREILQRTALEDPEVKLHMLTLKAVTRLSQQLAAHEAARHLVSAHRDAEAFDLRDHDAVTSPCRKTATTASSSAPGSSRATEKPVMMSLEDILALLQSEPGTFYSQDTPAPPAPTEVGEKLSEPNIDWGVCGFVSVLAALYDSDPKIQKKLNKILDSTHFKTRLLADIRIFLVMLKADEETELLEEIETFTGTFAECKGFKLDAFIGKINEAVENLPGRDFGMAMTPPALFAYLKKNWELDAQLTMGAGGGKKNKVILGLYDQKNVLKHWVYKKSDAETYNFGAKTTLAAVLYKYDLKIGCAIELATATRADARLGGADDLLPYLMPPPEPSLGRDEVFDNGVEIAMDKGVRIDRDRHVLLLGGQSLLARGDNPPAYVYTSGVGDCIAVKLEFEHGSDRVMYFGHESIKTYATDESRETTAVYARQQLGQQLEQDGFQLQQDRIQMVTSDVMKGRQRAYSPFYRRNLMHSKPTREAGSISVACRVADGQMFILRGDHWTPLEEDGATEKAFK